jgi:mycothiol synthase
MTYIMRAPTRDDAPEITALMAAFDTAMYGHADVYESGDVLDDWSRLDVATDAWVVVAPDGRLAAYATVTDYGSGRIHSDGYVHPDHWRRGLGTAIIRQTEARARELVPNAPEGARIQLMNSVIAEDVAARALLEGEGYTLARSHWRMAIEMEALPPVPAWPNGFTLRTYTPDMDAHSVFDAIEEAFQDHWGHVPRAFEDWAPRLKREDFDPSLWFLALDGDQIAGVALCRRHMEMGWVDTLAVRRPWRRHGLGRALLLQSFGEFYRRNERKVGLGVDAQSLTGANTLYQSAGMCVTMSIATYTKELRPGTSLITETLA